MWLRIRSSRPLYLLLLSSFFFLGALCVTLMAYAAFSLPLLYRKPAPRIPINWTSLPTPVVVYPQWQSYTTAAVVHDVYLEDEFAWIATEGGLVVGDLASQQAVKFMTEHGLPSNRLTAVELGQDGTVWVSSATAGVGFYDGVRWYNYTTADGLPSNDTRALAIDNDGVVWVATGAGLGRFAGQQWQWVRPSLLDFSTTEIRDVVVQGENLWVATAAGLWHFDGRRWETITNREGLVSDNLYSLAVAVDGSLWAGGDRGLSHYVGGRWERFAAADGIVEQPIVALRGLADGSIMLGYGEYASQGQVTKFNGRAANALVLPEQLTNADVQFLTTSVDAAGDEQLWVGTSAGLGRWQAGEWQQIPLPHEIPSNDIAAIAEVDGQIWTASAAGLQQFDGRSWQTVTAADGLVDASVRALDISTTGQIAAAYEHPSQGVSSWQAKQWVTQLCVDAGVNIGRVFAGDVAPNGDVWFLGEAGVSRYDGWQWRTYLDGWPAEPGPHEIAIAPSGEVWLGLRAGLYRLDESGSWVQERNEDIIRLSIAPNGMIWLATPTGLYHRQNGRDTAVPAPAINGLQDFLATDEAVWISGSDGVYQLTNNEWRLFNTSNGLASDRVTALTLSPQGQVWAAYEAAGLGFSFFDGESWQILHNNQGIEAGGLASNVVHEVLATPDGLLWFATDKGLSRYDVSSGAWGIVANGTDILQIVYAYDTVWVRTPALTARVLGSSLRQTDMIFSASDYIATGADGRLWAADLQAGNERFHVFDGHVWGIIPAPAALESVQDMAFEAAASGRVWLIGTPRGGEAGLYVWDGQQWHGRELAEVAQLTQIEIDANGRLWIGNFTQPWGRIFAIDNKANLQQIDTIPDVEGLPLDNLFIDKNDNVWASQERNGLPHFYQLVDESWRELSLPIPPSQKGSITQIVRAPDQAIWVSTSLGVVRYLDGIWEFVQSQPQRTSQHSLLSSGPPRDPVTHIAVTAAEDVWFGTSLGEIGRLQVGSLLYSPADPSLVAGTVSATLVEPSGAVWIATVNGHMIRFANNQWQQFDQLLASAKVQTLVTTAEAIWLGTDEGVVKLQKDSCSFVTNPTRDLFVVQDGVMDANKDIWWGTSNAGAVRYETATNTYSWPELSLKSRNIEALAAGGGNSIWFYYDGVLANYSSGLKEIIRIDSELIPQAVTSLAIDRNQRPWLGTPDGVIYPEGNSWSRLTTAAGLADNHVLKILWATDGSLWFATKGGISHYRPAP